MVDGGAQPEPGRRRRPVAVTIVLHFWPGTGALNRATTDRGSINVRRVTVWSSLRGNFTRRPHWHGILPGRVGYVLVSVLLVSPASNVAGTFVDFVVV